MAQNTDHIVVNCMRGGRLDCQHCGESFPLQKLLPLSINMVDAIMTGFRKEHRRCKLTDQGRRLQKIEEEYFEESKVKFIATKDQLFEFINSTPKFGKTYTKEEFDKEKLSHFEIYPIENVENGYFFMIQQIPNFTKTFASLGIEVMNEEHS